MNAVPKLLLKNDFLRVDGPLPSVKNLLKAPKGTDKSRGSVPKIEFKVNILKSFFMLFISFK